MVRATPGIRGDPTPGVVNWGEQMNQQLATAVRGDPADNVGEVAVAAPVVPVFVDATGRRRKVVTGFGWLVALACVAYLGVIGVSMTGTSVGPLPDLPSVASRVVVFGSGDRRPAARCAGGPASRARCVHRSRPHRRPRRCRTSATRPRSPRAARRRRRAEDRAEAAPKNAQKTASQRPRRRRRPPPTGPRRPCGSGALRDDAAAGVPPRRGTGQSPPAAAPEGDADRSGRGDVLRRAAAQRLGSVAGRDRRARGRERRGRLGRSRRR